MEKKTKYFDNYLLTLSVRQTETDTCANSVDPNETDRKELFKASFA